VGEGRLPKTSIDLGEDGGADGDPGGGPIDPDTGLREWYNPDPEEGSEITWGDLLSRWNLIEDDLHQFYGIDLEQPGLLRARTWRWLRVRIIGLLAEPKTRLFRALRARDEDQAASTREADTSFDDYE
jgi:hypothetical protein